MLTIPLYSTPAVTLEWSSATDSIPQRLKIHLSNILRSRNSRNYACMLFSGVSGEGPVSCIQICLWICSHLNPVNTTDQRQWDQTSSTAKSNLHKFKIRIAIFFTYCEAHCHKHNARWTRATLHEVSKKNYQTLGFSGIAKISIKYQRGFNISIYIYFNNSCWTGPASSDRILNQHSI